uniref:Digestive organ expansion factor n=1 Tax=Schistosoma haematobium TaxID=6185 RepID=A0A094ZQN5_SCHHA
MILKEIEHFFVQFSSAPKSNELALNTSLRIKTVIDDEVEKEADVQYVIASIKLLIIDQAEMLLMQNRATVQKIVSSLNQRPTVLVLASAARIRLCYLAGYGRRYRQTLLFSAVSYFLITSLSGECENFQGLSYIPPLSHYPDLYPTFLPDWKRQHSDMNAIKQGDKSLTNYNFKLHSISFVVPGQISVKSSCTKLVNSSTSSLLLSTKTLGFTDYAYLSGRNVSIARLNVFKQRILPGLRRGSDPRVLMYVSDFYGLEELRQILLAESLDFCCIIKYTEDSEAEKFRTLFGDARIRSLLIIERYYFFRKRKIRSSQTLIFLWSTNISMIEKLKIQSDRLKPKCAGIIYGDAKTTNNQNEYNFKNDSTDNIEDTRNNKSMMNPPVKLKSQRISSNKRKYLSALNKTAVVNTNAVSILREWKLYSDREREQRQKLCELESGAFTNAAYNSWKQEEEMKIKLNQLKKMECNRLNVMISHEASSTAKFDLCCKRKIAANKLRNEKHAKLLEFLNEKKLQQDKMNKVAKEVASSHENAKIAIKKLMEEKKKSASEILKESKQLLDEAAIKAEEEKKMKKELISQIQAEELSAIMTKSRNVKQIDLTNTPGHGLLNEMSIIELRERLNQSKINKQRELEEKRDAIINDKEQKTKVLLELLTRIGKHRSVKTVAATRKMVNNGE